MPTIQQVRQVSYSAVLESSVGKDGQRSPTGISPINSDRQNFKGIDVVNQIVYRGWEPGKEYTQNIVLKNLSVQSKKVKFR